jgi:hypothetical protein
MLYRLCGAAGMVGDEVYDPALRIVVARRLFVQRVDDLHVYPVVVVAVSSEELSPFTDAHRNQVADQLT